MHQTLKIILISVSIALLVALIIRALIKNKKEAFSYILSQEIEGKDFNKLEDKIVLDKTLYSDITKVTFSNQKLKYDGVDIVTLTGVTTLDIATFVSIEA